MDCSDKGNYQKQTCYNLKLLLKKKMTVVVLPDLLNKKILAQNQIWNYFLRICYTSDQLCVILKIKLDYKLDCN